MTGASALKLARGSENPKPIRIASVADSQLPEGWRQCSVDDVAIKVGSGITPTGGARIYKAFGRPFVRSQNVDWGKLAVDDLAYIDEPTHQSFSATELRPGDVLLNITGASIGRSAIADERIVGGNVNQQVCIIRTNPDELVPSLLNYLLLSKAGQAQIDSFQAGGNRQGLNFGQIRSFKLAIPKAINEQRAIALALSDANALIASLDALIAKKRDLKQAAMQQLLTGATRLPGFNDPWVMKRLGDVGQVCIGLTYKPSDVASHGTLVLRSANVQDGTLSFQDNVYVSLDVSERSIARADDILICVRNGSRELIGKAAKIAPQAAGMAFGAFMAIFRTTQHNFIFHAFQAEGVKRQIHEHLGATINQITNKSLKSFEVHLPTDPEEQEAIAVVLSEIDAELAALEAKRDKAVGIKQGMMQELLTGRIRLV